MVMLGFLNSRVLGSEMRETCVKKLRRVSDYEIRWLFSFQKISIYKPTDSLCATLNVATNTALRSIRQ